MGVADAVYETEVSMGTMTRQTDVYNEIKEKFGLVPEWFRQLPETALGGLWAQMKDFYLSETRIPNKYKDLIGLAVAGATHCRYCALFHTEAARVNGATDDEIAEANAMAGLTMNASTFVNGQQIDYEKFRKETLDIVAYVKTQQMKTGKPPQREPAARA